MDPRYGEIYRTLHRCHWWWRARDRFVLNTLREEAPLGGWGRILDVGCGDGLMFSALEPMGEVVGVEPMGEIVTRRERLDGTIYLRPFDPTFDPGGRFGLILMLDVLEHLDDPGGALEHAARLSRPGGTILVTVPAFRQLWTAHDELNEHRTRYTRESLHPLLRDAGFEIRESRYLFQWLASVKLMARVKQSLTGSSPSLPALPAHWLNRLLEKVCILEGWLMRRIDPPFGSSLMVRAEVSGHPGLDRRNPDPS